MIKVDFSDLSRSMSRSLRFRFLISCKGAELGRIVVYGCRRPRRPGMTLALRSRACR